MPHSTGRELEPALGKRAIEAEQAVDDGVCQRNLDAQSQRVASRGAVSCTTRPARCSPEARQRTSGRSSVIRTRSLVPAS